MTLVKGYKDKQL